jgi:hypothetical protein
VSMLFAAFQEFECNGLVVRKYGSRATLWRIEMGLFEYVFK